MVKCNECTYLIKEHYLVSPDIYVCLIQDNKQIFDVEKQRYCPFYYPLKTSANSIDRDPLIENNHTI